MYSTKILISLFLAFLLIAIAFIDNPPIAGLSMLLSALMIAIGVSHFLSKVKVKRVEKIRIEESKFIDNFVFRAYTKARNLWIVYDEYKKTFREANFEDLPVSVGLTLLTGSILLYASFMILSTLDQVLILLPFRLPIFVIFLTIGIYNFFVSIDRIASVGNKNSKGVCKELNKRKSLKDFIEREKISFEITPNFLLWKGFVTSIEMVSKKKFDTKPIEKSTVEIAKLIEKIR
jgi:hypothetical protein